LDFRLRFFVFRARLSADPQWAASQRFNPGDLTSNTISSRKRTEKVAGVENGRDVMWGKFPELENRISQTERAQGAQSN